VTYLDVLAARIRELVPPLVLPDGDTRALFLIYAVLARSKGNEVQPEDVHDAWVAWMILTGGEDHAALVPFDELGADVRSEDLPFVSAIRQAAREL
jgi:hypothetical protein